MTQDMITAQVMHADVIEQVEISRDVFRIVLEYDPSLAAAPGQFINLYLPDRSMLLPRPISICSLENGRLTLVYRVVGKGTEALAACRAGDGFRISTPLGHGYEIDAVFRDLDTRPSRGKRIALVAGGLGVPPMIELAKTIRNHLQSCAGFGMDSTADGRNHNTKLTAMLGFQQDPFLTEELSSICDEIYIATESGLSGYHGNVLDMMESMDLEADYYLSCGPKLMMKALAEYCSRINRPLQVSLEERMGCGYGACVGCTCKTREIKGGERMVKQKKVCTDGPVFFGNEVIWDE